MKTIAIFAMLAISTLAQARQVTFAWNANPAAEAVTEYRLLLKDAAGDWQPLGQTNGVELTVAIPDTVSTVAVVAVNSVGLVSERSAPLVVPVTPSAPAGLRIKITVELQSSKDSRKWSEVASIGIGEIKPVKGAVAYRLR